MKKQFACSHGFESGFSQLFCFLLFCFNFPFITEAQSPGNVMFQPQIGVQKILIIRVIYPDDTTAILHDSIAMKHVQSAKTILETNSYGLLTPEFDITPLLMMPQPSTFYMLDNRLSFVRLRADAIALAEAAGYPESAYDKEGIYTKHVWPHNFKGVGGVNRRTFYMAISNPSVMVHEIGHLYDFRHANFLRVMSNNPLDPDGEVIEYGDRFGKMGDASNPHHFNPWYKTRVGWIPRENILTVTSSGTYSIQSLENAPRSNSAVGAFSALRIRNKPGQEYWIYYRSQEEFANAGALIMRTEPRNSAPSILLDMNPFSLPRNQDYQDAALEVGRMVRDTAAGIQITLENKDEDSLRVKVVVPDTHVPAVPAINFISPEFNAGSLSGTIIYEATAFDPEVAQMNGAGIDSVLFLLGYPEGDDPFGEGTEFILKVSKAFTAPPYIMEIDSDTLPDESYRLMVFAKTIDDRINLGVLNHMIDNTGSSISTSILSPSNSSFNLICFPNPFNESLIIQFEAPTSASQVELDIYNMLGQKVETLINEKLPQGSYAIPWNGGAHFNQLSGNYICRLRIGQKVVTKPILKL